MNRGPAERGAGFVYDAAGLAARAAGAPVVPVPRAGREDPFRLRFVEITERRCGGRRSAPPGELHGGWVRAGWTYGGQYGRESKTRPGFVPYARLGRLERDKNAVFVALCEIAGQWIYDVAPGREERP